MCVPPLHTQLISGQHPTFRPPRLVLRAPPYEVRRLGWGTFTIEAEIVLKEPYNWIMDNAGSRQPGLELTWTLDFEGRGHQSRVRAKVQKTEQPVTEDAASGVGEGRRTRSTRQAAMSGNPSITTGGDADDDEEEDDDYEEADIDSEESQDEEEEISEFIATPRR